MTCVHSPLTSQSNQNSDTIFWRFASPAGFEPTTPGVGGLCSSELSYDEIWRPAMRFERMTYRIGAGRSSAELRGQYIDSIYLTCMCFPYILENMQIIRKTVQLLDVGDDAKRQFIDAQAVFQAFEEATKAAAEVRGGMYWKRQGSSEYLIRTSPRNAQKSLGLRSPETEALYSKFAARKEQAEARKAALEKELVRHQRMNRALFVGRTPQILIDILRTLAQTGLSDHFLVIGTHALYAYEAAAGVRFVSADAMATRDVDLLWDTRKRISFVAKMEFLDSSMIGLLRKVDPTFDIRQDQHYTAINDKGFEVDIIRRDSSMGDPHPLRVTEREDDLWAVQATRANDLLSGPRFSSMIVSASGHMARMETVSPVLFAEFKRWMADQPDRDPFKASRDRLQAELVEQLIEEYLPNLMGRPGPKP